MSDKGCEMSDTEVRCQIKRMSDVRHRDEMSDKERTTAVVEVRC